MEIITTLPRNREVLFGDFMVETRKHYGHIEPSMEELLLKLTLKVNDNAFTQLECRDDTVDYIGPVEEEPVKEFVNQIMAYHLALPPDRPLYVRLTSGGGEVYSGLALCSVVSELRRAGRVVNCHVTGWAMSMAFDWLQYFDHRSMESNGFLMVHEEQYEISGSTSAHKTEVKFSEKQERALLDTLSARTGKPVDYYIKKTKNENWYLNAQEALAEGMIDEITSIPAFAPPKIIAEPKPPRKPRTVRPKVEPDAEAVTRNIEGYGPAVL